MIRALAVAGALALGPAALAQEAAVSAPGGILRVLDKTTGLLTDLDLASDEAWSTGRLTITLRECRYPQLNPSGDAFAWVEVAEEGALAAEFEGWMIASSPALSALDHPRYDVWVLRCRMS